MIENIGDSLKYEACHKNYSVLNFFYILYLLFIPLNMPDYIGKKMPFTAYGVSFAFFPFLFVFILVVIKKVFAEKVINPLWFKTFLILFFLCVYSALMGKVYEGEFDLGYFGGDGVTNTLSYSAQLLFFWLIVFVNSEVLKSLSRRTKQIVFLYYALLCIFISILQFMMIYVSPQFKGIYDKVNFLGVFPKSNIVNRITGFGKEPSSLAEILCVFLIPYLIYQYEFNRQKKFMVLAVVLVFVACLSLSTTVYAALLVLFFVYILCILKNREIFKVFPLVAVCLMVVFFALSLNSSDEIRSVVYKAFDLKNQSSAYRYSSVYNDIMIFLTHPFGVGDGNQGYYYLNIYKKFATSGSSEVIKAASRRTTGPIGGGPFGGSLISGYGIIGIIVLILVIRLLFGNVKDVKSTNKPLYNFLTVSTIMFLFLGTVATGVFMNFLFGLIVSCFLEPYESVL